MTSPAGGAAPALAGPTDWPLCDHAGVCHGGGPAFCGGCHPEEPRVCLGRPGEHLQLPAQVRRPSPGIPPVGKSAGTSVIANWSYFILRQPLKTRRGLVRGTNIIPTWITSVGSTVNNGNGAHLPSQPTFRICHR